MKADKHQIEAIVQRLESCISELRQIKDDCVLEEAVGWLQDNEPQIALSKLKTITEEQ